MVLALENWREGAGTGGCGTSECGNSTRALSCPGTKRIFIIGRIVGKGARLVS